MAGEAPLLALEGVVAGYDEIEVLRGVTVGVGAGEIVSIIGANGAGKSTLLRTVFGMLRPRAGTIRLEGRDIGGRPSVEILKSGIGYVPQGRCNFPAMSVAENLEMAIALLLRPRLLLVDEPSLGLDPRMVELVFETILTINREGTAVLMVEQNAKKALAVSHRGFVLELGRNRFEGTGQQLLDDPDVRQHYLGGH